MSRTLGLDVGDKTIGVAVTDPMGWTAQGVTVIRRQSWDKDIRALKDVVREWQAERLVVGLPLSLSGEEGPQAEKVRHFMARIQPDIDLPVEYVDERLTTRQAERALIEGGMRREKRREIIDMQAAILILQLWLDRRRLTGTP